MELIAHRGASHIAPENTLAAVRLAWEEAADGIEIDIHLTADGEVVLLHDASLARTTGHDEVIADLPWDKVSRLDAGSWKAAAWAGEPIPSLEEVLTTVPSGKSVFIEVKCGPAVVEPLARVVAASGIPKEDVVLVGAQLATMRPVKAAFADHTCYWVVNLRRRENVPDLARELVQGAADAGLDGLGLSCCEVLDDAFVDVIKQAGQELFVWTVDDPEDARRMKALGADSLATNRPGWLREELVSLERS